MPTFGGIGFGGGGGIKPAIFNEGSSSGASFSTLTNPDGDGKNYRLATFTATGTTHTLAIEEAGIAQFLIIGGGGSTGVVLSNWAAGPGWGGGRYLGSHFIDNNASVVIGAGGVGNPASGGASWVAWGASTARTNLYVPGGVNGAGNNLPGGGTTNPGLNGLYNGVSAGLTTTFAGGSKTLAVEGGNLTNTFTQNTGFGGAGSPTTPAGGYSRSGANGVVYIRVEI